MVRRSCTRLLLGLTALLFVSGNTPLAPAQAIETQKLCYAFLIGNAYHASDLYAACYGVRERITQTRDIWDFAITTDGTTLALRRQRGTEKGTEVNNKPIDVLHFDIEVVSLGGDFGRHWSSVREFGSVESLKAYCGSIFAIMRNIYSDPLTATYSASDVLTGLPLSLPPYVAYGCSADGKTVVGYLDALRHSLWAGLPPQQRMVQDAQEGVVFPFDVSPNGHFVAYDLVRSTTLLCMDKDGKRLGCLSQGAASSQKISVSDTGTVLYDGGTGSACGGWECQGVFYWRPGTDQSIIAEPVGWHPEWITPQVAAALRAWKKVDSPKSK